MNGCERNCFSLIESSLSSSLLTSCCSLVFLFIGVCFGVFSTSITEVMMWLVGGLYGVGFDRVFCGESMFSLVPDASKVALAWLVATMKRAGATLLDCQFLTEHLASMGAIEIGQKRYLSLLKAAQRPYSLVTGPASDPAGRGEPASEGEALGDGEALALPDAFGALLSAASGSSSSPGNFIAQSFTQTS